MSATIADNKRGILRDCEERRQVVDSLPFYYHVHLNMPCNQRCIMCVPDFRHARDTLPFEAFVAFFDQVKPYAEHITLLGGEPLMYPWLNEVLGLLAEHPIAVTISTNGFMLTERFTPGLLALDQLNLRWSIDAANEHTYRKIRGRDHFARATSNVRRFAELAADKPQIHLIPVFVVMRENLDQVLPFIDFVKPLRPHHVQFQPVAHVRDWRVENGTGWTFDGAEQSCESFADEYNDVMRQAVAKSEQEGVECEVLFV